MPMFWCCWMHTSSGIVAGSLIRTFQWSTRHQTFSCLNPSASLKLSVALSNSNISQDTDSSVVLLNCCHHSMHSTYLLIGIPLGLLFLTGVGHSILSSIYLIHPFILFCPLCCDHVLIFKIKRPRAPLTVHLSQEIQCYLFTMSARLLCGQ